MDKKVKAIIAGSVLSVGLFLILLTGGYTLEAFAALILSGNLAFFSRLHIHRLGESESEQLPDDWMELEDGCFLCLNEHDIRPIWKRSKRYIHHTMSMAQFIKNTLKQNPIPSSTLRIMGTKREWFRKHALRQGIVGFWLMVKTSDEWIPMMYRPADMLIDGIIWFNYPAQEALKGRACYDIVAEYRV